MCSLDQNLQERILVLAPTGGDAVNAMSLLNRSGFTAKSCANLIELCVLAAEGAGACLIAEEALLSASYLCLAEIGIHRSLLLLIYGGLLFPPYSLSVKNKKT